MICNFCQWPHIRSQTELFLVQKTLQRCSTSNSTGVCFHENGEKRAESCPAPLLLHHQQAEEMGWCMWRGCDVMWFHCPSPHGIIPSGGKPLRLCWHITPPIINSKSALSFLLYLSSFLLPACHSFSSLPPAPSPPLTFSTFLLIFHLNNHLFFLSFPFCLTHHVILQ